MIVLLSLNNLYSNGNMQNVAFLQPKYILTVTLNVFCSDFNGKRDEGKLGIFALFFLG